MPIAMYKAMKETQLKVRINKPACYRAFRHRLRPIWWLTAANQTVEDTPHKAVSTTTIYTCPNKWLLDKGCQATDIADFLGREVSEMEWDLPRAHRGTLSGSPNRWA